METSKGGRPILQDFYYFSVRELLSVLYYLYPAKMTYFILMMTIIWLLWSALYVRIMKQYDFDYPWMSFLPFGKLYFRLKIKKRPYIVLVIAALQLLMIILLFFMEFSFWMILPGSFYFLFFLLKWSVLLTIDRKIWIDFKIDERLFYLVLIPGFGLVFYLVMMGKIAFSPELYYEYEEDDIGEWI